MSENIDVMVDEVKELVSQLQKKHEENAGATSEEVEKMKEAAGVISEKISDMNVKLDAETTAREELELSMARIKESGSTDGDVKSNPEYLKGFTSYLKGQVAIGAEIVEEEFKNLVNANAGVDVSDQGMITLKALLVGSNPDGGYFVPVERLTPFSTRMFETSPMRSLATVISASSEAIEIVLDDDQADSGWVGELDARTETDTPQVGIITIPIHEQYAEPKATQKVLDDAAINIDAWLTGKIADKFARTENTAFVNGTGVKQPTGFMTYANWAAVGTYQRDRLETLTATGTAGALDASDDLISLQGALLEAYQANATWTGNRETWTDIMTMKDGNDNYLLNLATMFQDGTKMRLLGKPFVIFSDMADVAAAAVPLAYGDFREGYTIADRIGIRVLRDPFTSKGYVKFYTTKRVGGALTSYQSIKRLLINS